MLAVSVLLTVSPLTDSSTENRPWLFTPGLRVLNTGLVVWGQREERRKEKRGEEGKVGGQKEVLSGPLRLSALSLESLEDCPQGMG